MAGFSTAPQIPDLSQLPATNVIFLDNSSKNKELLKDLRTMAD